MIRVQVNAALSSRQWHREKESALREPEAFLRWEPWEHPEEESRAHYGSQSAIVATLMGDREQVTTLVAQLITEPMNRKLAIGYFLGNLTEGRIGAICKGLPTKSQILEWIRESSNIDLTDRLDQLAKLAYD